MLTKRPRVDLLRRRVAKTEMESILLAQKKKKPGEKKNKPKIKKE